MPLPQGQGQEPLYEIIPLNGVYCELPREVDMANIHNATNIPVDLHTRLKNISNTAAAYIQRMWRFKNTSN